MSDIVLDNPSQTLSIRFLADGFYFTVSDPSDAAVHHDLKFEIDNTLSMTANLKRAFDRHSFLRGPFAAVHAVVQARRFTLVPADLFDETQTAQMLDFNLGDQPGEKALSHTLHHLPVVICYGIDRTFYARLCDHFPDIQIQPHIADLLGQAALDTRQQGVRTMYAMIDRETMLLAALDKGSLVLCNQFECSHTEDRLYYLLGCWRQILFSQVDDHLILTHDDAINRQMMAELKRYIAHTSYF